MIIFKQHDIRRKIKELAISAVALLTMTAAAQTDEVLTAQFAEEVSITNFDMSFVDPTLGLYLLADRSNNEIFVLATGSIPQSPPLMFYHRWGGGRLSALPVVATPQARTESLPQIITLKCGQGTVHQSISIPAYQPATL